MIEGATRDGASDASRLDEASDGPRRGQASDGSRGDATSGPASDVLREVREGLQRDQKELSPKYFYDRRGSELFEEITNLPEYYLTRAEVRILEGAAREWLESFAPVGLVELGAGSARKTRLILDGMHPDRPGSADGGPLFAPVDVSAEFLGQTASALEREYPGIRIRPVVADISSPDFLDGRSGSGLLPELGSPALFALLGSTIGNFRPEEAVGLLHRVREAMGSEDAFLLGVDLRPGPGKPLEVLEAAYDDPGGVTAEFNRNVLRVLNRTLGTRFDPSAFRHLAFYDQEKTRIEMHLEAVSPQRVELPDGTVIRFDAGETLRTELSCKYDRTSVAELFAGAGLELSRWLTEEPGLYAMAVGVPSAASRR